MASRPLWSVAAHWPDRLAGQHGRRRLERQVNVVSVRAGDPGAFDAGKAAHRPLGWYERR